MPSDKNAILGAFERAFDADAVKSDTVDLPIIALSILVGVSGTVKVTTVGGDTVTVTGTPAGGKIPLAVRRIFTTGTSATGLVGLFNTAN